jgi:hypothetical protein
MTPNRRPSWWIRGSIVLKCGALKSALFGAVLSLAQETTQPPFSAAMNDASACLTISGNNIHVRLRAGTIQTSADKLTWLNRPLAVRTFLRGATYGNGLFVVVGGSYFDTPGVILTSRNGLTWTRRHRTNRKNLYGVTFGDGAFVAVGDTGAIVTSVDGIHWKPRGAKTDETLLAAIAFGNGRFVGGGESGAIITSTNGVDWIVRHLNGAPYVGTITFRDDVFVVANRHTPFVSSDGLNWRRCAVEKTAPHCR